MTHDCPTCGHSGLVLEKACPRCNSLAHVERANKAAKPLPAEEVAAKPVEAAPAAPEAPKE